MLFCHLVDPRAHTDTSLMAHTSSAILVAPSLKFVESTDVGLLDMARAIWPNNQWGQS